MYGQFYKLDFQFRDNPFTSLTRNNEFKIRKWLFILIGCFGSVLWKFIKTLILKFRNSYSVQMNEKLI